VARIAGIDLPKEKRVVVALRYIYGIGETASHKIMAATGVNPDTRVHKLTDEEVVKLRDEIEANYRVEGALRGEVQMNVKRLIDIGCYRGTKEEKRTSSPRPSGAGRQGVHPGDLQQHDHHHHRPER
jgi:small subunit ribosomal protein S13